MTPDMLVEGFAMSPAPSSMPTGTVTFLMTDVEGSTRRWEAQPELMRTAMVGQLELLAAVIEAHGGFRPEEQGEGDSVLAAFERATDAVAAALDAQRALLAELGEVFRVRMAVHTDEVLVRNERNYAGPALNRAARLRACGHGGQVLVSGTTADLLGDRLPEGVSLIPLGRHRLRDLNRPEEVWQLVAPDLPSKFPPLQSLDAFATNLPIGLTSLIGRVQELEEVGALVTDSSVRLITLTGPGGVGKTRLALQVARDNAAEFADGVWWAELAPVADDNRVAGTIARAMGLPEAAQLSPLVQVQSFLGGKRSLVVMDNCEHLVDSCAVLADEVLRSCPGVTVLATSREPLGTSGERVWRVPSLSLPSVPETASPDALTDSDAVRLFVERARQARSHFELSTANVASVSEICRRLDGIPLALELAAARIRSLPVERLATQLHERFHLLTGGARTALARQQTLLASVEWSYDLLSDDERLVLRRLAVFVGTFTVEAAERVTAGEDLDRYEVVDLLGHLADKSLVQFDEATGRYSLLETIRQYALDRCRAAGELQELRDRHLHWVVEFLEERDSGLCARPVFEAIDAEYANIRAALEWATEYDLDGAIRIAGALSRYWGIAGRHHDAVGLTDPVLVAARAEDPLRWARLVSLLAWVRTTGGDPEFGNLVRPALEIARQNGDPSSEAGCLYVIAITSTGERGQLERVFELARRGGNARFTVFGAQLAAASLIGTEPAEALLARAARVAEGFDDGPFQFLQLGWMAMHAALRGNQTEGARLARLALQQENRSLAAEFQTVANLMGVALQGADRELAVLAGEHIWTELRHLPGSEWWVQLVDVATTLADSDRTRSTLPVPERLTFGFLNVSDLVARVLLTDGRLDDAVAWASQVPTSWPAAHASAGLALAWVAVQRGDPNAPQLTSDALLEAAGLGLRPFATEALELLASQWAAEDGRPEAARLLGAAAAARAEMGVAWRYPYHQAAVDAACERLRLALSEEAFEAALREGADTSLEEALDLAKHIRRSPLPH